MADNEKTQSPPDPLAALTAQLEDLTTKSAALIESMATAPTPEEFTKLKDELASLKVKMADIEAERLQAAQAAEVASLRQQMDEMLAQRSERKFQFNIATSASRESSMDGESFATTLWKARKGGDFDAYARLKIWHTKNAAGLSMKALGETTSTAGGVLVPPEYIQELVALRRSTAPLLGYVRQIPVTSNQAIIPQQTGVSTVGWTAENATKPSTDEVMSNITVNLFTLAGISKVSNQLLEDSSPTVDVVVRQDLGRGLNIEMDRAIINGTGTGQPTGILNTSGVISTPGTSTNQASAQATYDDILSAISRLQQGYFGNPDLIVMSPRSWGSLLQIKDTTNRYLSIGVTSGIQEITNPGIPAPTGSTANGLGMAGGPVFMFAGIPIVIDANMPITLGAGSDSAIIVGAFREAWALMRDDVRMDVSNVAGTSFETNQTWFRGECRMGFTAGRITSAFQIISGVKI